MGGGFALLNNSNRSKVLEFKIVNDRNSSAATVNFTVSFDDNSFSNSTVNVNLSVNETAFVFAGHDYAAGESYLNASNLSNTVYVLELTNTSSNQIATAVVRLINATKI